MGRVPTGYSTRARAAQTTKWKRIRFQAQEIAVFHRHSKLMHSHQLSPSGRIAYSNRRSSDGGAEVETDKKRQTFFFVRANVSKSQTKGNGNNYYVILFCLVYVYAHTHTNHVEMINYIYVVLALALTASKSSQTNVIFYSNTRWHTNTRAVYSFGPCIVLCGMGELVACPLARCQMKSNQTGNISVQQRQTNKKH